MKIKTFTTISALIISQANASECNIRSTDCQNTILGPLEQITAVESKDGYSHLLLAKKEIFRSKSDYMVVDNDDGIFKNKKYLITKATLSYISADKCEPDTTGGHCAINLVLDFTSGKPVISNPFFSGWSDSTITWVSWGKTNAIISIDNYLRFKYENGHVEQISKEKNLTAGDKAKK